MPTLQAINVSKSYGKFKALDKVTIEVNKQSVFGFLGPNGAGKTTLIRIINMISVMDEGQVLLDGKSIKQSDIQNIGYLPEERGLYKKMKVGEQALYFAQLKDMSKNDALKKLKYWFEKFEIETWWDKKVEELSKGMQQKIQFIVTILHEPELLIFDEPFSGFDPINANLLKAEILSLKDQGATIIFSTHNMGSVEEICDDIALINNSKKILGGSMREVKKQFKTDQYQIIFDGDINGFELSLRHQYKILENRKEEDKTLLTLEILDNNVTTNDLIQSLLPIGKMISFSEIVPSMNDIFIRVVGENKKEASRE